MDVNRGDLSFVENNPLPHALITTLYGLLIGLIQFSLLRKHFFGSAFWIVANTLAWEISILITAINVTNDFMLLITFVLGTILHGAITGATLLWILQPKEIKK